MIVSFTGPVSHALNITWHFNSHFTRRIKARSAPASPRRVARRRIAFPNSLMSTPHTKTHELNTTDETQQLARFSKQNAMNEDDDETENMQE